MKANIIKNKLFYERNLTSKVIRGHIRSICMFLIGFILFLFLLWNFLTNVKFLSLFVSLYYNILVVEGFNAPTGLWTCRRFCPVSFRRSCFSWLCNWSTSVQVSHDQRFWSVKLQIMFACFFYIFFYILLLYKPIILNISSYSDWNLFWDVRILRTREIMMLFK